MKYRFQCAECGYAYKSLWYEPNWIAKLFYIPDHKSFHYTSWTNDYPSQWKRHGAETERERIVALLKKHPSADDYCEKCWAGPYEAHIIRLIKGEK